MTDSKQVPREPTPEMCSAGYGDAPTNQFAAAAIWTAMYDAAPTDAATQRPSATVAPAVPPDVAGLCARLDIASIDERHSTGALYQEAAAALRALSGERDQAQREANIHFESATTLAVALAAAKADAARFRYLLANAVGYAMHMGAVLYTPELVLPRAMSSADACAAIDAAIGESEAEPRSIAAAQDKP